MKMLLHSENLDSIPLAGKAMASKLLVRIDDVSKQSKNLPDPGLTVLIRTRNDMAFLTTLFNDISEQVYDGKIEIVVVDTESTDGTAEFARSQGAKVISIKQRDFTYPRGLNLGFAAATQPYVMTLVGHSALVSKYMFKSVSLWAQDELFGGMYGTVLPNWNASKTERFFWIFGSGSWLDKGKLINVAHMGTLGANAAVVKKSVWQTLGKYDERYAGGGEDGELAKKLLAAGYHIAHEPLCSVHHSNHLGPINLLLQSFHWTRMAKPTPFNAKKLWARRPDLRS